MWTTGNCPLALRALAGKERRKALEIGNTLIQEGYDEDSAAILAVNQARAWQQEIHESNMHSEHDLCYVHAHPAGWVVRAGYRSGAALPQVFGSRAEAVAAGVTLARQHCTNLVIHYPDGQIQGRFTYMLPDQHPNR